MRIKSRSESNPAIRMTRRCVAGAGLAVFFSAAAFGQISATLPDTRPAASARFEVASVKQAFYLPSVSRGVDERGIGGGCPTEMKVNRARVDFKCVTLAMLIGYAFRLPPVRITGPDWMMDVGPRFDIAAK